MIQRMGEPVDDGYTTLPGQFEDFAPEYARIIYGSGREQREAAQEGASQTATFEVLSNAKTRTVSVTDRICYPVGDPDPAKWPVWDVIAAVDLGYNEGVRLTAVRQR
jgi:hypothetical protein